MDLFLFELFHSAANRSVILDGILGFLANYLTYFLIASLIILIYRAKDGIRQKMYVFISLALSAVLSRGILTEIIRFFYDRPRPFDVLDVTPLFLDDNPSFPSGHTAFLFALTFALFHFNKKAGWWFAFFSFVVVLSRISAGVHWPSDILGGVVVAVISVFSVRLILRKYEPKYAEETLTSAS
ncbi:MAG TPA: phosphatase PAP2 family protein [Candidatus Paceibacterota bacterium]|nr:phosphatase PAP2 family protein [Candidatus Paceibacterota bacterium]